MSSLEISLKNQYTTDHYGTELTLFFPINTKMNDVVKRILCEKKGTFFVKSKPNDTHIHRTGHCSNTTSISLTSAKYKEHQLRVTV